MVLMGGIFDSLFLFLRYQSNACLDPCLGLKSIPGVSASCKLACQLFFDSGQLAFQLSVFTVAQVSWVKLDQKTMRKIGAALALPRKALRKRAVAPSTAEPGAAKEVTPAICEKTRSGSDPSSAEHDSLPARLNLSPQSRKVFFYPELGRTYKAGGKLRWLRGFAKFNLAMV